MSTVDGGRQTATGTFEVKPADEHAYHDVTGAGAPDARRRDPAVLR